MNYVSGAQSRETSNRPSVYSIQLKLKRSSNVFRGFTIQQWWNIAKLRLKFGGYECITPGYYFQLNNISNKALNKDPTLNLWHLGKPCLYSSVLGKQEPSVLRYSLMHTILTIQRKKRILILLYTMFSHWQDDDYLNVIVIRISMKTG